MFSLRAGADVLEEPYGLGDSDSCSAGQVSPVSPEDEMIDLALISALNVTECLRLLAVGPGLMRDREVTG